MSGPNGERCEDCYFAANVGEIDKTWAVCKRSAPPSMVVNVSIDDRLSVHPVVKTYDWCGEFKTYPAEFKTYPATLRASE